MTVFDLYGVLTDWAAPLIRWYLRRRAIPGKEDPARLEERFGITGLPRPGGRLVWAHAASVGEALSLLPLLEAIERRLPESHLIVTSGTVTSANLLEQRLPAGIPHQYVPVDMRTAVRRFLDHWRPDLALFVESELWPNLLIETHRRGVAVILLNGRLSETSFKGWMRFQALTKPLFRTLSLVLAQDERHAARWRDLGVRQVDCAGDLKAAATALPIDETLFTTLNAEIGGRPVWLAASTHEGEEAIVFDIHRRLRQRYPRLLTILASRHPVRADGIAEQGRGLGLTIARHSKRPGIAADTDIYLADTMGEMGLFYRLAPIVLMAGSLDVAGRIGGHNPLEAARLGRAIIHGPDIANCLEITLALDRAGGAVAVNGPDELESALDRLLSDPEKAIAIGARAQQMAMASADVVDQVMISIEPWLVRLEPAKPATRYLGMRQAL